MKRMLWLRRSCGSPAVAAPGGARLLACLRGAALDLGFGDPKAIGKTTGGPLEAFKKA